MSRWSRLVDSVKGVFGAGDEASGAGRSADADTPGTPRAGSPDISGLNDAERVRRSRHDMPTSEQLGDHLARIGRGEATPMRSSGEARQVDSREARQVDDAQPHIQNSTSQNVEKAGKDELQELRDNNDRQARATATAEEKARGRELAQRERAANGPGIVQKSVGGAVSIATWPLRKVFKLGSSLVSGAAKVALGSAAVVGGATLAFDEDTRNVAISETDRFISSMDLGGISPFALSQAEQDCFVSDDFVAATSQDIDALGLSDRGRRDAKAFAEQVAGPLTDAMWPYVNHTSSGGEVPTQQGRTLVNYSDEVLSSTFRAQAEELSASVPGYPMEDFQRGAAEVVEHVNQCRALMGPQTAL